MTALEIIYSIREGLKEYVDDTKFTDSFLLYRFNLERATYIRQQYNRIQRPVDQQLVQTFLIPVSEVDDSEYEPTVSTLNLITRTDTPLPNLIELDHRTMLERVTGPSKLDQPINIVSKERFYYAGSNDYDIELFFCYLDGDNHIYLKSLDNEEAAIGHIAVSGVLENPLDVLNFDSYASGKDINTFNYPIKSQTALMVIDTVIQKIANTKQLPTDIENDAADDATILRGQRSGQ